MHQLKFTKRAEESNIEIAETPSDFLLENGHYWLGYAAYEIKQYTHYSLEQTSEKRGARELAIFDPQAGICIRVAE